MKAKHMRIAVIVLTIILIAALAFLAGLLLGKRQETAKQQDAPAASAPKAEEEIQPADTQPRETAGDTEPATDTTLSTGEEEPTSTENTRPEEMPDKGDQGTDWL